MKAIQILFLGVALVVVLVWQGSQANAGNPPPITGVFGSTTMIVGSFTAGPLNTATQVNSFAQFQSTFGTPQATDLLESFESVQLAFLNGAQSLWIVRVPGQAGHPASVASLIGSATARSGLYSLPETVALGLVIVPELALYPVATAATAYHQLVDYAKSRQATAILDLPASVQTPTAAVAFVNQHPELQQTSAAIYFPRLKIQNAFGQAMEIGASGALAGIVGAFEANVGIWRAPAGIDANVMGATGLAISLNSQETGILNQASVNPLLTLNGKLVVMGARTLWRASGSADYIQSRRLATYISRSLNSGLKWVAFEPNDFATWNQVKTLVTNFMQNLFQSGAFSGATPVQAYFVKCDSYTTSDSDVAHGIMNIVVGYAVSQPSEFTVETISISAGAPASGQ